MLDFGQFAAQLQVFLKLEERFYKLSQTFRSDKETVGAAGPGTTMGQLPDSVLVVVAPLELYGDASALPHISDTC